jgi:HME family heavy-metal exporter
VSSTLLDTLLTPVMVLRFGRKATERLLAEPALRGDGAVPQEAF